MPSTVFLGMVFFMKNFFVLIMFLLVIGLSGCGNTADVRAGTLISLEGEFTTKDIASSVKPAIVGISGIGDGGESVGSGVCVAKGGYILTNSHVINDSEKIELYLSDGTKTTASVIYEDTVLDLAILQSKKNLPYLSLGDSDELQVGQDILAVGTPLSLTLVHTYTKGIVSAINRTLKVSSNNGEGYMQNLIQHDASLNPGNSGGPLINAKGEVVGINTLKISSGEGIGFAIPSKSFRSLLSSYVNNINYKKPYLGVYGYDNEIANFKGESELNEGFYVIDVSKNSPLNQIGLKPCSVITDINNRRIKNTLDLKEELYKVEEDDVIVIGYYQDGKFCKSKIQLSKV